MEPATCAKIIWEKWLPRERVCLAQTLLHQCFTCNKINLRCCSNSFLGSPWYCRFCCSSSHSFYWGSSGCCCTCCSLYSTTHNHWFCWWYGLSELCVQLHHLNKINMSLTLKLQLIHSAINTISQIYSISPLSLSLSRMHTNSHTAFTTYHYFFTSIILPHLSFFSRGQWQKQSKFHFTKRQL